MSRTMFITPPDFSVAADGKLLPIVHVNIVEFVDGVRDVNHRCVLVQQLDGSWAFDPPPLRPDTGEPFVVSQAQYDAWNAVLDVYELGYGIADHEHAPKPGVEGGRVTYTQNPQTGLFKRSVEATPALPVEG